ncbi:MAG TPA: phosphonate ABC transporter ATP-binding protein [Bacilli bacterium]|nr:phosphonate ABC transporter ATP-binding protein [Bacilli bacterium]
MIKFENVSKQYGNGTIALRNVDLTIEQGEFVAIIGLSGAGKSTLIRLVNKMIEPTSGHLEVNGVTVDSNLKGKPLRKFRRKIGMVFQSFNLIERTTVIKNVLSAKVAEKGFFASLLGYYSKQDYLDSLEALNNVGIIDKAYIRADQLSGGQMQRVALSRTLAQNPTIILADEPVASLDPVTANMIMADFERVNKKFNITVIINIHHVDIALKFADRILGIHEGKIVFDGPSGSVTEDILRKIYNRELSDDDVMFKKPTEDGKILPIKELIDDAVTVEKAINDEER